MTEMLQKIYYRHTRSVFDLFANKNVLHCRPYVEQTRFRSHKNKAKKKTKYFDSDLRCTSLENRTKKLQNDLCMKYQ